MTLYVLGGLAIPSISTNPFGLCTPATQASCELMEGIIPFCHGAFVQAVSSSWNTVPHLTPLTSSTSSLNELSLTQHNVGHSHVPRQPLYSLQDVPITPQAFPFVHVYSSHNSAFKFLILWLDIRLFNHSLNKWLWLPRVICFMSEWVSDWTCDWINKKEGLAHTSV